MRRIAATLLCLLGLATACTPPPEPGAVCKLFLVTQLPLRREGGHWYTEVGVNGRTANMAVDTGAFLSALTDDAVDRYKVKFTRLRINVSGIGGSEITGTVSPDQVSLGRLKSRYIVFDKLSRWHPPTTNPPVDGLLGHDILGTYDVDYDLLGGHLTMYRSVGRCADPSVTMGGTHFQAEMLGEARESNAVVVAGKVGDTKLRVQIDTGAEATLLTTAAATRLGIDVPALMARGPVGDLGGVGRGGLRVVETTLPSLSLGDAEIPKVRVVVGDIDLGHDVDVLLGQDFLRRIHLWIANSHRTVIFQVPPQPSPVLPAKAATDPA